MEALVHRVMAGADGGLLSVPLVVDMRWGSTWAACK